MDRLWLFIREWFREWWGLMGCAAFTFLGIYIAGANKSNAWVVGASVILGSAFFFAASYRAWLRQHDARLKAEADLNAEADMRGTIWFTIMQHNPLQDQTKDGSGLRFHCRCANHGQKSCEISRALLILSGADFENDFRLEKPFPLHLVKTVGPGEQFICNDAFTIRGVKQSQLSRSEITIHLVDSLGTEYTSTVMKMAWGPEFDRLSQWAL